MIKFTLVTAALAGIPVGILRPAITVADDNQLHVVSCVIQPFNASVLIEVVLAESLECVIVSRIRAPRVAREDTFGVVSMTNEV